MQKELLELKKQLNAILSRDAALKQALREVNKIDMIRASMIVRNPKHQEVKVDRIIDGELIRDISIGDYVFIRNCAELVKAAYNNLEMGNYIDRNLLISAARILSEDPECGLRKDNPVVYSINHVPPHCSDIEDRLTRTSRKVYGNEMADDVVARAMYMHNSIIDIWPFDEYSGEIAIFAMNYYLMEQGLMPIDMPMKQQDYFDLVAACLKGWRPDEEYEFFKAAITTKMISTIEICKGYVR
ncbi:MAG: Fic family protein [Clostridia bacterium]|nr:Fic family protein [Clostridia bacterium]